jgi:hypothetical protein
MRSLVFGIINIILIASLIIVIFILILNSERGNKVFPLESPESINNYKSQKITIKQLDSLSASANIYFSLHYTKGFLLSELR